MSDSVGESVGAGEPQARTGEDALDTAPAPAKSPGGRRLRGRTARWAAVGAVAVVVIGGAAAAAAIHHHEEEGRGEHKAVSAGEHEEHGEHEGRGGPGEKAEGRDGRDGREGRSREAERGPRGEDSGQTSTRGVPAPLPSLSAADALNKAAGAVNDGKVESLAPVAEQGGGRAWRIVVVGPDGVRHAVTVDGAGGTLTGNTVLGG